MMKLYPLVFEPIFKERIWGGNKLKSVLNKNIESETTGESWELSAVSGDVSVVGNGFYKGTSLTSLLEQFPEELLGKKVFKKFGNEFPLLFKFLDAKEDLSIQVHPNDELAKQRHNSFGKSEMWYVMQADENAKLIVGFKKDSSKEEYMTHLENKTLVTLLDEIPVEKGDVFFLETGTVHAIGAGTLIAEIQQTSDITYRLYDFDRKDINGNLRELHVELALDAINYNKINAHKEYKPLCNQAVTVVDCPYFKTNMILLDGQVDSVNSGESFLVYMCTEGEFSIWVNNQDFEFKKGDTILMPASISDYQLIGKADLLEITIS
jgi:mannose-6-phosphate isomerase